MSGKTKEPARKGVPALSGARLRGGGKLEDAGGAGVAQFVHFPAIDDAPGIECSAVSAAKDGGKGFGRERDGHRRECRCG